MVAALMLLFGGCIDDSSAEIRELEQRVDRLEARLATSTTSSTTTTTLDIEATPPVTLPVEQARTRLQRELPAALDELWEAEWCLDHQRELEEAAAGLEIEVPADWREEAPDDFGAACRAALDAADPAASPADYTGVVAGAVDETTAEIVDEVASDTRQLQAVLEDMPEELRSFCGGNPDLVYDAGFAMGRLPRGASGDLEVYWAVTRPHEYAAACREAYEAR